MSDGVSDGGDNNKKREKGLKAANFRAAGRNCL
jgi:hypothetical protein